MENKLPETLQEAIRYFSDDLTCIKFLASLRWEDGKAICPKCESERTSFLATRNVWKCNACKKQFSIKSGTIFEDSAIKLDKWLVAVWLIAGAKNGISSHELGRALGLTQKSAWFVLHRIRTAMTVGTLDKMTGTVEVDETFIGGLGKNMHKTKRRALKTGGGSKTCVMGLIQRKGRVRAKVIPQTIRAVLHGEIEANVAKGSTVYTDQYPSYSHMTEAYKHEVVNHTQRYVDGAIHTNSIENFWSLLKRTVKGTYISVSPEHLQAYVNEQVFRFNERSGNDLHRFLTALGGIIGKRLTYNDLIGNGLPCT